MKKEQVTDTLNMLREMLLDEQKAVTYVSLSKDLCIHVNDSKYLLIKAVEDIRGKENISLNVNYIISGLLDGFRAKTVVCNENELSSIRQMYKTIFFEHIYSVSRGSPDSDNVSLLALNKFEDFTLYSGLIKNTICSKRTSGEIDKLKTKSTFTNKIDKPVISMKKVKDDNQNGESNKTPVSIMVKTKSESKVKSESTSPLKKVTIESLSPPKVTPISGLKTKSESKSQKGIAGFFNKSSGNKISSPNHNKDVSSNKDVHPSSMDDTVTTVKSEDNIIIESYEDGTKNNNSDKLDKMDIDYSEPKASNKLKKEKNTPINRNKNSLGQIKKSAKVDKQRKRLLHVSDSESDNDDPFVDEEKPKIEHDSDDEIPPTPTVNTVKFTSGIINPKKKRKIVDKTYTDEDGYILTKKEEVYESCSDNDEKNAKENINKVQNSSEKTVSEKKTVIKNNKKKVTSPQKGKQATLMSFFKKV